MTKAKMKGKIFKSSEIISILSKQKTQFREVIKPQPIQPESFSDAYFDCYNKGNQWNWWTKDHKQLLGQIVKCPYQVGQKIFCKESFREAAGKIIYRADYESYKPITPWRRAMKQEHSRLTLLIKEIKVERLADISEEDAIAEGMEKTGCLYLEDKTLDENKFKKFRWVKTEISDFAKNWNATHKKPEEKFEANPWIWKIEFEIINN
jgi:hypothetical protein